jgi:hypothetical protein
MQSLPYDVSGLSNRDLNVFLVGRAFPREGMALAGVKPDVIASLYGRVLAFVDKHMH